MEDSFVFFVFKINLIFPKNLKNHQFIIIFCHVSIKDSQKFFKNLF